MRYEGPRKGVQLYALKHEGLTSRVQCREAVEGLQPGVLRHKGVQNDRQPCTMRHKGLPNGLQPHVSRHKGPQNSMQLCVLRQMAATMCAKAQLVAK